MERTAQSQHRAPARAASLIIAASLILGTVALTAGSSPASASSAWTAPPSTSLSLLSLDSVDMLSQNAGFAVGWKGSNWNGATFATATAAVMSWNGQRWSSTSLPSIAGANSSVLASVSGTGSNDVWTAGWELLGSATSPTSQPLLLHWNGSSWKTVSVTVAGQARIYGVTTVAANNVWAVGLSATSPTAAPQPLILHWNGAKWTTGNIASQAPGEFISLSMVGSTPYAAGEGKNNPLLERYSGGSWSTVTVPASAAPSGGVLVSLYPESSSSIWAAGNGSSGPFVLHWNGAKWAVTTPPTPAGLSGVVLTSIAGQGSQVWASGYGASTAQTYPTPTPSPSATTPPAESGHTNYGIVETWNGTSWAATRLGSSLPNTALYSISAGDGPLVVVGQTTNNNSQLMAGVIQQGSTPAAAASLLVTLLIVLVIVLALLALTALLLAMRRQAGQGPDELPPGGTADTGGEATGTPALPVS